MQDANVETVQLSKTEYATLQNAASFLKEGLWNNKDIGLKVKQLAKEKFKDVNIPELESEERLEAQKAAFKEELATERKEREALKADLEADKKARQEKDDNLSFMEQYNKTKKDYNFTDEGMEKVMARMKEKNNPDIEAAAAFVARQEPSTPVSSSNYSPTDFDANKAFGGFEQKVWEGFENPDSRRATENDIINQVMSNPGQFREFGGTL